MIASKGKKIGGIGIAYIILFFDIKFFLYYKVYKKLAEVITYKNIGCQHEES